MRLQPVRHCPQASSVALWHVERKMKFESAATASLVVNALELSQAEDVGAGVPKAVAEQ